MHQHTQPMHLVWFHYRTNVYFKDYHRRIHFVCGLTHCMSIIDCDVFSTRKKFLIFVLTTALDDLTRGSRTKYVAFIWGRANFVWSNQCVLTPTAQQICFHVMSFSLRSIPTKTLGIKTNELSDPQHIAQNREPKQHTRTLESFCLVWRTVEMNSA